MTLLAAYAFNEGSGATAAEVSGGPDITGVPAWADGGMYINGVAGPTLDPFAISGPFTIMFDAYVVGNGGNGVNILLNNPAIGNVQVINFDGALQWYLGPNPTTGFLLPGEWKNVAITGDNTARKAYLDGLLVGTSSGGASGSDPLVLGGFDGYFPNARLKNLRVFDNVLTEAEIDALAGTPVAPSEEPNQPPIANAGPNQNVIVGQQVTLSGSGSDTDGTIASYSWTKVSGPPVTLAGSGATRTFTPTVSGTYIFALTVTDDDDAVSTPDTVTVLAQSISSGSGGGPSPFARIESAVKELVVALMPEADGLVGGDLSYDAESQEFYIWLGLVPGGRTTEVDGEWILDIDVFDTHYAQAMDRALALEPLLIKRGGHRTSRMRIDSVTQNEAPVERPWDDESAYRIGATYVFTARRSG